MIIHPTHAGSVVYRYESNEKKYLLISAKNNARDLVLPKGHIEVAISESPEEAALRELKEETGIQGAIEKSLGCTPEFEVNNEKIVVEYFLVKFIREEQPNEERELQWLSLDDAVGKLAPYPEARNILELVKDASLK